MGTVVTNQNGRVVRVLPYGTGMVTQWESGSTNGMKFTLTSPNPTQNALVWGAVAAAASWFLKTRIKPVTAGLAGAVAGYLLSPKTAEATVTPATKPTTGTGVTATHPALPQNGYIDLGDGEVIIDIEAEDAGYTGPTEKAVGNVTAGVDIYPAKSITKGKTIQKPVPTDASLTRMLSECLPGEVYDHNFGKCLDQAYACAPPNYVYLQETNTHPAGCYNALDVVLEGGKMWNAKLSCPPPTNEYEWRRVNKVVDSPTDDPATWKWESTCERMYFAAPVSQEAISDSISLRTATGQAAEKAIERLKKFQF